MAFIASLVLPVLAAVFTSGVCSWLWRASLPRPVLFGAFAFLVLLGLHRVLQAAWELSRAFVGGGYFLEYHAGSNSVELIERQLTVEAFSLATLVVLLGIPLLLTLRNLAKS